MRLIDIDAFRKVNGMADNCVGCERDAKECNYDRIYTLMDFCTLLDCAPIVNQWIPCSERLPEPNRHDELNVDVYYLAQTEFGDMIVASYNESHEGTKWWEQMYSYRIFDDEIVAWMPLPEKYKGE